MAVFGAPIALEDHAFRACLAALDLQQEAQRLGAMVDRRDGVELRLRVGLNSGEVIAGEMGAGPNSYTTIGEQVGLAQRMESVAPPGGVMLSESTARLVVTTATLGDPEMVRIKGADAPVIARRLITAGSNTRRPARQLSTLVGRDWEMATIAGMLQQSTKGKGRIVGLVGPPGIGKSRLTAEISSLAADDAMQVFTACCESHTSEVPFRVATCLLREIFAIGALGEQAARASIRARIGNADPEDLVLLDDLLGIRDDKTPLPDIDPAARRRRLAALLNAAAADRTTPSVYVIEDVHWIDEVSEAMIAEFAAVVPQTCALLLLTYRPEYRGALDRLPSAHRIALSNLDAVESATLATELLGADDSVAELVAHISGRAAGNPFFAEELVRDLAERGVVEGAPGAYVCRRDPTDLRVPASLQAAIAARVDRLSTTAKRTLNAAAVVGMQFDTDLLGCLVSEVELPELVSAELIDQVTFTGRGQYVFRHPLIRTVAYESQLKADRSRLHRDLANAIRDRAPALADANAALVAQHLEAAGDHRDAFDWHMRAGAWAQHRDITAARTSWQRASAVTDLLPGDGPGETAMRIAPRALLCANTWRFGAGLEDTGFDELRELCLHSGDSFSLSAGMAGMLTVELFHNRYSDAARIASDCIEVLESISDPDVTLAIWGAAANAKIQAGEATEGLRLAERIIDLADGRLTMSDDLLVSSPLAFGYGLRGVSRLSLGIPGWREDVDDALRIARSADTTTLLAMVVYRYAIPMHNGAVMPDARGIAETAETHEIAQRSGDDFALDCAYLARGTMLVNADGPDRATGFELLAEYRASSLRKQYTTHSVRIVDTENAREKLRLGDLGGAIALARPTVDFLFSSGEMTTRGLAASVLVESLLRRGADTDIAEASAAIDRLAAVRTDPGYVLLDLPLLRMRALLAQAQGDEVGYREFADKYRTMANDLGFEGHIASAAAMT